MESNRAIVYITVTLSTQSPRRTVVNIIAAKRIPIDCKQSQCTTQGTDTPYIVIAATAAKSKTASKQDEDGERREKKLARPNDAYTKLAFSFRVKVNCCGLRLAAVDDGRRPDLT